MRTIVLAILVLICFYPASLHAIEENNKTVLILYSFGPSYPAIIQWDRGIRTVFASQNDIHTNILAEYLDLSRYNEPDYIQNIIELFKYKYTDAQPDLIITVFEPAINFILNHRNELFPEVQIVYGGIEKTSFKYSDLGEKMSGITMGKSAFKETINLALKLHPETHNAVVISGEGYFEKSWLKPAREAFEQYHDLLNINYLQGLSLDELLFEVKNLPDNTLVFYLPVLEDKSNQKYIAVDVCLKISEACNVPVYSFWEIFINNGATGGYMNIFQDQAQLTANMALSILRGISPDKTNSFVNEGLQYIFDYQQLKRWSISESKLPPGAEIRNKKPSLWKEYPYQIILISVLFLFLLLIIGYYFTQRRILRKSQIKLRKAEQKYKTIADYTVDWEYWLNPDGSIQWVSPSCERISGYSVNLIIENPALISNMIKSEDKKAWAEHQCLDMEGIDRKKIQYRIQTAQGEYRWIEHTCQLVFDDQGNNIGVRANNRDITEKESYKSKTSKLQSDLFHIERVSTISTLSYALAHEINQPLASIRSYAQAALRFMDKDHSEEDNIRKALNGIVSDNKRAASIINQMRNLVRKDTFKSENVDINYIIKEVLNLLKSEIVIRNVKIKLDLDLNMPAIKGDFIHLQQVLLNLLINSLDAMEGMSNENKVITISTTAKNLIDPIISIADSGSGIPKNELENIFEPFKTSKTKGLGLGLAISKSIIESHDGKIWVENNAGGGAKFVISLPKSEVSKLK